MVIRSTWDGEIGGSNPLMQTIWGYSIMAIQSAVNRWENCETLRRFDSYYPSHAVVTEMVDVLVRVQSGALFEFETSLKILK